MKLKKLFSVALLSSLSLTYASFADDADTTWNKAVMDNIREIGSELADIKKSCNAEKMNVVTPDGTRTLNLDCMNYQNGGNRAKKIEMAFDKLIQTDPKRSADYPEVEKTIQTLRNAFMNNQFGKGGCVLPNNPHSAYSECFSKAMSDVKKASEAIGKRTSAALTLSGLKAKASTPEKSVAKSKKSKATGQDNNLSRQLNLAKGEAREWETKYNELLLQSEAYKKGCEAEKSKAANRTTASAPVNTETNKTLESLHEKYPFLNAVKGSQSSGAKASQPDNVIEVEGAEASGKLDH